jgi:hypothetical protein
MGDNINNNCRLEEYGLKEFCELNWLRIGFIYGFVSIALSEGMQVTQITIWQKPNNEINR